MLDHKNIDDEPNQVSNFTLWVTFKVGGDKEPDDSLNTVGLGKKCHEEPYMMNVLNQVDKPKGSLLSGAYLYCWGYKG